MRASLNLGELGELMLQIEEQEPALLILSCESNPASLLPPLIQQRYPLNDLY